MVISFFTHHLCQPWQEAAHFLARMFIDYEQGIHYPQLQIQAGETGVNTIRIYNPVLKAKEHHPKAEFILQWLPELRHIPVPLIFEPWQLSAMQQALYQCRIGIDDPQPLVDVDAAAANVRDMLLSYRTEGEVRKENMRILQRHTLRRDEREKPHEAPE
jgi:deoxyribodipyrimidine photo-lyase